MIAEVMAIILMFVALALIPIASVVRKHITNHDIAEINRCIEECDRNNETFREDKKGGDSQ